MSEAAPYLPLFSQERPGSLLHLGLFLLENGRPSEAAEAFSEAAETDGGSPSSSGVAFEAAFNAGVAFRTAGDLVKAEQFYRKARDIRPEVGHIPKKTCRENRDGILSFPFNGWYKLLLS